MATKNGGANTDDDDARYCAAHEPAALWHAYLARRQRENPLFLRRTLSFVPGQPTLTLSNIKDKSAYVKGSTIMAGDVSAVKEYSCVQGLVAADKAAMGELPKIREAMLRVMEESEPTYT